MRTIFYERFTMSTPQERFDETLLDFIDRVAKEDLSDDTTTVAMKNLEIFSKCRPPVDVEPETIPEPVVPTTRWERFKAGANSAWDNETTRVTIKAVGAFAGVALVAYSTIYKDHVLERQAIAQANQRMS